MSVCITNQIIDRLVEECKPTYSQLLTVPRMHFDEKTADYFVQRIIENDIQHLDLRRSVECENFPLYMLARLLRDLICKCNLHTLYFGRVYYTLFDLVDVNLTDSNFSIVNCQGATMSSSWTTMSDKFKERNKQCLRRVNKSIITFLCICKYSRLNINKDTASVIAKLVWKTRNNKMWAVDF